MTPSELFLGKKSKGTHKCYYCGADCGEQYKVSEYVKDTFTNRDIVKYPQSGYVCEGCMASLGEGEDDMLMIDGTIKHRENKRGMCPRMYSWVLTKDKRLAATKAHIKQLREIIINPPEPPFAIILADSGQKQLIFRAPIALDRNVYALLLEDEKIDVDVELLKHRLDMALPVCAALGKPALTGDISFSSYTRFMDYAGDITPLDNWLSVRNEPISRLAAWLCKSREDAQNEYPAVECRKIPAGACRTGRQEQGVTGNGTDGNQGRDGQVLLDFS